MKQTLCDLCRGIIRTDDALPESIVIEQENRLPSQSVATPLKKVGVRFVREKIREHDEDFDICRDCFATVVATNMVAKINPENVNRCLAEWAKSFGRKTILV